MLWYVILFRKTTSWNLIKSINLNFVLQSLSPFNLSFQGWTRKNILVAFPSILIVFYNSVTLIYLVNFCENAYKERIKIIGIVDHILSDMEVSKYIKLCNVIIIFFLFLLVLSCNCSLSRNVRSSLFGNILLITMSNISWPHSVIIWHMDQFTYCFFNTDTSIRSTLIGFRDLVKSRPIHFTASNFYRLDYTLVVKYCSVIITYTTILIQNVNFNT